MAEIFLSYARKNLAQVRQLRDALLAEGFEVWWDQDVPADAEWDPSIEAALNGAKTIVVCWSEASAGSENVRAEARWARNKGLLLQAYLEPCGPPFFFGERQGADLTDWDGDRGAERFQFLAKGVRDLMAGKRPQPGLGFRPRESRVGGFVFAGAGLFVAAAAGVLWIPEVRDRVFPPPPVAWTMSAGPVADFRPGDPPEMRPIERMTSTMLIGLSPEFAQSSGRRAHLVVARERATLHVPGARPIDFAWLWFTDNSDHGAYIERRGNAAPFTVDGAGGREIMFAPVQSYAWSDFVRDVHAARRADQEFMTLAVETAAQSGEQEILLRATCSIPLQHVLSVIQDRRLELKWVSVSCGAPASAAGPAP